MMGISEIENIVWHPAHAVDAVCLGAAVVPGVVFIVWVAMAVVSLVADWWASRGG